MTLSARIRAIVNDRYLDRLTKRELLEIATKVETLERGDSPVVDERNSD